MNPPQLVNHVQPDESQNKIMDRNLQPQQSKEVDIQVYIFDDPVPVKIKMQKNNSITVKDLIGTIMNVCNWSKNQKHKLPYPTNQNAYNLGIVDDDEDEEEEIENGDYLDYNEITPYGINNYSMIPKESSFQLDPNHPMHVRILSNNIK